MNFELNRSCWFFIIYFRTVWNDNSGKLALAPYMLRGREVHLLIQRSRFNGDPLGVLRVKMPKSYPTSRTKHTTPHATGVGLPLKSADEVPGFFGQFKTSWGNDKREAKGGAWLPLTFVAIANVQRLRSRGTFVLYFSALAAAGKMTSRWIDQRHLHSRWIPLNWML